MHGRDGKLVSNYLAVHSYFAEQGLTLELNIPPYCPPSCVITYTHPGTHTRTNLVSMHASTVSSSNESCFNTECYWYYNLVCAHQCGSCSRYTVLVWQKHFVFHPGMIINAACLHAVFVVVFAFMCRIIIVLSYNCRMHAHGLA